MDDIFLLSDFKQWFPGLFRSTDVDGYVDSFIKMIRGYYHDLAMHLLCPDTSMSHTTGLDNNDLYPSTSNCTDSLKDMMQVMEETFARIRENIEYKSDPGLLEKVLAVLDFWAVSQKRCSELGWRKRLIARFKMWQLKRRLNINLSMQDVYSVVIALFEQKGLGTASDFARLVSDFKIS